MRLAPAASSIYRDNVDSTTGTVQAAVFYGANVYARLRRPSWTRR